MNSKKLGGIILGGIFLVGGIFFFACTEKVKPGYVGVIYSQSGGIQGDTLSQGRKIVLPWNDLTQYSISTEQAFLSANSGENGDANTSFDVTSKDGKKVNVDLQYSYRFDESRVPEIFNRFKGKQGKDIEDTYMRANVKVLAGEVVSDFTVFDAYGAKRGELNDKLEKHLREAFAKDGIIIEKAAFTRLGLDEATDKAIQETVNKQQEIKTAQLAKEKAQIEQSQKTMESEAEAKRKLIEAKAEKEANEQISKSLTPELIKKMEMEARQKHGWVTVKGADTTVIKDADKKSEDKK